MFSPLSCIPQDDVPYYPAAGDIHMCRAGMMDTTCC